MRTIGILSVCLCMGLVAMGMEADFFVAPDGSDTNPGSIERPFASLGQAQRAVRQKLASGDDTPVSVLIRQGTYRLDAPLVFGPADSGKEKTANGGLP